MRIAVPDFNGYVAPLFDEACTLALIDLQGGSECGRLATRIQESSPVARATRLSAFGIDVLVCGAISKTMAALVAAQGIRVVSGVCGPVDDVVRTYVATQRIPQRFVMPGVVHKRIRPRTGRGWRPTDVHPVGGPGEDRAVSDEDNT